MNPLTVFPRHPSAPDTYYINGAWAPAAITAVEKRFSPGELAAEYWRKVGDYDACTDGYSTATDGYQYESETVEGERMMTLHRFCTQPAHDDGPA